MILRKLCFLILSVVIVLSLLHTDNSLATKSNIVLAAHYDNTVNNPLGIGDAKQFISKIVNDVSLIFGFVVIVILFALMIYSGYLFIFAGGSEENIEKAKKIMVSAVIGMVILSLIVSIVKLMEAVLGIDLGFDILF